VRSTKSRAYRMSRRAELVDQTREQITAAAARLHTTVGPANTTIASIADEAGVTRLTVYRHFNDLDVLFEACRAHWRAENPPPNAAAWLEIPDLERRARRAIAELYAWFRDHADELFPIYRDMTSMPVSSQERMRDENGRLADMLLDGHATRGDEHRLVRAVARHLLDYRTWRSLAIQQGLTDAEAVDLGVRWLTGVAAEGPSASR
jgi:AcrR family transcriptional regulator